MTDYMNFNEHESQIITAVFERLFPADDHPRDDLPGAAEGDRGAWHRLDQAGKHRIERRLLADRAPKTLHESVPDRSCHFKLEKIFTE